MVDGIFKFSTINSLDFSSSPVHTLLQDIASNFKARYKNEKGPKVVKMPGKGQPYFETSVMRWGDQSVL